MNDESTKVTQNSRPWYREPWPWILMAGPAAAVVAGAVTLWIAVANADGLVADDYYRRGLEINRDLGLQRRAEERGIEARVTRGGGRLRVELRGSAPEALFVQLQHATLPGHDQRLRLARAPDGGYETALAPLAPGHWRAVIQDARGEWEIVKERL